MRVVILGLDGLEATVINPEEFPNLCQSQHGTVSLEGFSEVQTPQIWTSFITGVLPEEHGVDGFKCGNTLSSVEKHLGGYVKKAVNSLFGLGGVKRVTKTKNRLYDHWGVHPYQSYGRRDIKKPTFFDEIPKSYAISVPVFNEPQVYTDIRRMTVQAVGNKDVSRKLTEKLWKLYDEEVEAFYECLEQDWNLVMLHLFISDVYGHIYGYSEKTMFYLYKILDEFVGEVKKQVSDALTIVVSDHGTKRGLHTPYGFWSCNKPIPLENPRVTDFHDIILEAIG